MITLGVQKIRRFLEYSEFTIRPITVLVGRNSSGKSTLLRLIPLLRQSLSTRVGAPLLWYGDLVDFGSYESVVSDHSPASDISFVLKIDNFSVDKRELTSRRARAPHNERIHVGPFEARYVMSKRDRGSKSVTFLKSLSMQFAFQELDFTINFSDDGTAQSILLNSVDLSKVLDLSRLRFTRRMLSPFLIGVQNQRSEEGLYTSTLDFVWVKIYEAIRPHIDRRVSNQSTMVFARRLLDAVPLTEDSITQAASASGLVAIAKFAQIYLMDTSGSLYRTVKSIADFLFVARASESAMNFLSDTFMNSLYLGPARARSDRYYRYQELAISDIAPDGSNLPMFLNSLTGTQLSEFSRFVSDSFGFGVSLESTGGHISIFLTFDYDRTNIVDSGFGVSQLLPILAQLWWATSRHRRGRTRQYDFDRTPTVVAIEQPELHLHPAHQAQLADVFVQSLAHGGSLSPLSLVVETHSSELINRLGALIEEGKISADSVQIVLVDEQTSKEGQRKGTTARSVTYSRSGVLQNWPSDFFIPSYQ